VALGALDPEQADGVLDRADHVRGTVGAGLIAFDVAPHRDAHLQHLKAHGPRPLIIAGGSIPLATQLTQQGFDAWMHTPSPRLAGLALSAGVPAVVLEGHEAGGHVGPLPSSWLWERGLEAAIDAIARGRATTPLVVLAGGIGDAISAAFAAALAAPAHAAGVRVAFQVGTAFFATSEISDQLTQTCRDQTLRTTDTVLVGSTVGLPLRCAPNAFTDSAVALEQQWLTQGLSLMERRLRMETQNVGRTRVAAKGIERSADWDGQTPAGRYQPVPVPRQRQEGAFTLGQGAMVTRNTQTVAELIHALTIGARNVLDAPDPWGEAVPVSGEPSVLVTPIEVVRPLRRGPRKRAKAGVHAGAPIAIVGVGCALPGGADVVEFWRSQVRGCDAVGPIPASRWDPARYHDPKAGADGPAYSASIAAALVAPIAFDSLRYRIPPTVLATVDPSQRLALLAADEAFTDAGWAESGPPPERASVVLGNAMGGEWSSRMALRVRFRELVDALVADGELDADARAALEPILEARLDRDLLPLRPDSMVGLLGNLVAARVAAWLDWRGGTHTVDAACAASLVAVGQAVDALRLGRVDAVLTGGIDTDLAPETYVGFSRTLALSSGGSRPFSSAADGFVMGEGGAVFALKRLDEAMADGDPIWAVIRGVATASDGRGRGLTAPLPDGQLQAVRAAWADAGLDPQTAAYVEAHGTGTTLGDRTEATVLSQVFAPNTWVGTAKGSVGHLKSAAGAAGLLRAVLTVATGVVPPTLHAGDPIDQAAGLRLPRHATRPEGGIARAGVSAFGFGGTNAHIVIEAPPSTAPRPRALKQLINESMPFLVPARQAIWTSEHPASAPKLTPSPTALLFAADSVQALALAVEERRVTAADSDQGEYRAALLTLGEDAALRVRVAAHLRGQAQDSDLGRRFWLGQGSPRPLVGLVPGQGTQRPGALASVRRFPACHERLERLKEQFSADLSAPLTPDTRHLHAHLFSVSTAWAAVLEHADIHVDQAIGHSLGEWGAAVLAGAIGAEPLAPAVQARGEALHAGAKGAMLAVVGPPAEASALARSHALTVAARNSHKTTILSGAVADIEAAHEASGPLRTVRIAVAHPFHSPAMQPAAQALVEHLSAIPNEPHPRWISAMSADHSPLRQSLVHALTAPVEFVKALEKAASNALFVEVGPGATLTAHARATGLDAIALDPKPGIDPHGVHRAALALWCAGHPGLMHQLPDVYLVSPTSRRPVGPAAHAAHPIVQAEPIPAPDRASHARSPTPERPSPTGDTRDEVIAAIAEVTGYDDATIVAAQDLQRDLGVDSIQRLEVLGLLQERLNLHAEDEDLASLSAVNVDVLVDLVSRSTSATAPPDGPTPIHALRPRWRRATPSRCAPPPPGWSTYNGRSCWAGATETSPLQATLSALLAAQSAPESDAPWVAWVPNTAPGRASAAALRIAAAEASRAFTEARVEPGAQGLAQWPDAQVIRVLPDAVQIRRWAHHLGPAPTPHAKVLATGGVRGIVVPILRALAPERVCLIGRTPAEHPQVQAALTLLQQDGIKAEYRVVDLAVPGALDGVGSQATLVLHGAGALRDGLVEHVTPDDVEHTFEAKVQGLSALRRACPDAHICALSSLAAHAPSPGQFAYAAANAAVEALADSAIASTAWSERGMASSNAVQAALRARGVTPLPLERGAQRVAASIGLPGTTLITTHSPPDTLDLPWPATQVRLDDDAVEIGLTLDPTDPRLAHHKVAGQVVVPAAVWLDLVLAIVE
ncbi:MAG: SDR family NAD(P)-dependent oxidoreductase, partial [Myxococcota bacterium]